MTENDIVTALFHIMPMGMLLGLTYAIIVTAVKGRKH